MNNGTTPSRPLCARRGAYERTPKKPKETAPRARGPAALCLHCLRNRRSASRGLCKTCYLDRTIRQLYPAARARCGTRGIGGVNANPPAPLAPTGALQGTEEKLRILEERAAAGLALWHEEDRGMRREE